jgi:putative SOS response-associated peptidase YedK
MCNEYRFRESLDKLAEEFSRLSLPLVWTGGAPNLEPRDSIRPTDPAPVILGRDGGAQLHQLRWGFPRPKGGPVINFRSEGRSFPSGRCLIPASGFYEFTGDRPPKSKWLFTTPDDALFCIAGLMRDDRFTLLTIDPGPDVASFHDRQIVILPREDWAAWLNGPPPRLAPSPAGTLKVAQIR